MAGFDPRDSTSADEPVPDYTATLNDDIAGLKIGLPQGVLRRRDWTPACRRLGGAARSSCYEQLGATRARDQPAEQRPLSVPVYYVVAPAECSSNLARFDGVRYGHRCDDPKDLEDLYKRSRAPRASAPRSSAAS
jgi:aspartyl-tRNA(Asn)/glutamyl-tRNA(Gln) amidotransferase subunit A